MGRRVHQVLQKIMTFRRRVGNIREAGFNFREARHRVAFSLSLSPSPPFFHLPLGYPASADSSSCAVSFDLARATTRLLLPSSLSPLPMLKRRFSASPRHLFHSWYAAAVAFARPIYLPLPLFARWGFPSAPLPLPRCPSKASSWLLKISPVCRGI